MALGDVICAWLLLRGAEVALERLNEELPPDEKSFYEGKVPLAAGLRVQCCPSWRPSVPSQRPESRRHGSP